MLAVIEANCKMKVTLSIAPLTALPAMGDAHL